jgi:PAS domain S-box-containing protein
MNNNLSPENDPLGFLAGGGEMAERIRDFDWSKTDLGPPQFWSPALRTTLGILIANRFPHILWWGPNYVQFYNDPYCPIPGSKHPDKALAQPANACWSEIWHIIGPLIDRAFQGGPATWDDDILLVINRHGFLEESHFTIAYSPVPDETVPTGIGGVLATVHEITGKVIAERRVRTLRDLGARVGEAKNAQEACAIVAQTLAAHDRDIPFALFYLIDSEGTARLAGAAGVEMGQDISPLTIELSSQHSHGWPMFDTKTTASLQVVEKIQTRFTHIPDGPWPTPPHAAVVVPIPSSRTQELAGLMVAGVSARIRLDQDYRDFFGLVASLVSAAIANARAYEEEKQRAEALTELDRAKTAFFSNVSHEFRTPLTLMISPVEDILTSNKVEVPTAAKEQLQVVHRNGLRLQKLVNTLLDFSRIEAGRVQASYEPTDLGSLTAELASNFRSACEKVALELVIDSRSLSEPVYVDRDMWEKIVLNLLSNAFKFTLEGRIEVVLRQSGGYVELAVRDTGIGIPDEQLPKVFERFHRVEGSRGRTQEGSGIGLALVRELVKLHGGSVRVESTFNKGSAFTVTVPLGSAHLPADRISSTRTMASTALGAAPFVEEALRWLPGALPVTQSSSVLSRESAGWARTGSKRYRILLADDNADMRDYVQRLLSEQYDVTAVADGHAAWIEVQKSVPDLILTDVMMPGLDGFGLLRQLRSTSETKDLPVILLSARAGDEARIEGLGAAADDYITKPFSAKELLASVRNRLELAAVRRESQEILRQREEHLRAVVETTPACIKLLASDGTLLDMNRSGLAMIDATSLEAVKGKCVYDLVSEEYRAAYRTFNEKICQGESGSFEFEMVGLRGTRRWMETHAVPLRGPNGSLIHLAITHDATERKLAEKALRESEQQLKEADHRKDEFLATLAHELRNPLAPIRNGLHFMRLAGNDDNLVEKARLIMERQVQQMVRLVDDLLDVARISQNKLELRKELLDLSSVVNSAVETSRPIIDGARHRLEISIAPELIRLHADPVRLAQAISNLLNNAAKYSEPARQIWLTAKQQNDEVVVSVRDTGMGIPQDELQNIFGMFVQADHSMENSKGGLGIGLTLVQRIVRMHGGAVEAHSGGRGKGSEFIIRLPGAAAVRAAAYKEFRHDDDSKSVTPLRILVVDDNSDSAESMALMLKFGGHTVAVANDGLEGLETAKAFLPHAALLDLGMPKLNGYETAHQIRQQSWGKNIVLIALTGWGQEEDKRRSREAGFNAHLVKPVDHHSLEKILRDRDLTDRANSENSRKKAV